MQLTSVLCFVLLCYGGVVADGLIDVLKDASFNIESLLIDRPKDTNSVDTEDISEPNVHGYSAPRVVEMSDVTWLPANNTSIVFPSEELRIASTNETDAEYGPCQSPVGSGHCRHFRYCVLNVFTSLQADYLPYMCRISGYAGVCCPVQPALDKDIIIQLRTNSTIHTEINQNENIVINTISSRPGSSNYVKCDVKTLSELIQCGINHLRNGHFKKSSPSLTQVTRWNITYDKLIEINEKELDNLGKYLSQKCNREIDNITRDYEDLLKDRQKELKDKTKKLCISEISNGNFANAVSYFNEMEDDSQLPEIIKTVYIDYGKLEKLEYIINFVKQFSSCNKSKIAYPALFNTMKAYSHSENPKILALFEAIQTCMRSSALESEMLVAVKSVIDSWMPTWASDARSGADNSKLKEVSQKCPSLFESYIDTLIANAYANNVANVANILKFIDNLLLKDKILALSSLLKQMKTNNHLDHHELLLLGYRAKELMDYNPNMSDGDKYKLTNLKNSLPSSVSGLIWNGKKCSVRSVSWDEYMYSPDGNHIFNGERRHVFTWRHKGQLDHDGYWVFEAGKRAKSFKIKSFHNNEYLYSPNNDHLFEGCCNRRYTFTWMHKGEGDYVEADWILEPVDSAKYFVIKSVLRNEYLYAAGYKPYNDERRYVFSWMTGTYDRDSFWDITCN